MGAKLSARRTLCRWPFEREVCVSGGRGIESPPGLLPGLWSRGHPDGHDVDPEAERHLAQEVDFRIRCAAGRQVLDAELIRVDFRDATLILRQLRAEAALSRFHWSVGAD